MKRLILALVCVVLLSLPAYPSLLFATTGDVVDCGSGASLDNLTTLTYAVWMFRTGLNSGASAQFIGKGSFGAQTRRNFILSFNSSAPHFVVDRATTDASVDSTTATGANAWEFWAVTYTSAGGIAMFRGDLATEVADVSTSAVNGSGTTGDDSAENFAIGNAPGSAGNWFPGRLAWAGVWNRVLTIGELQEQQFRPHPTNGCVGFWWLGFSGTGTHGDLSGNGNTGTVTGAAQSSDGSFGSPFGR